MTIRPLSIERPETLDDFTSRAIARGHVGADTAGRLLEAAQTHFSPGTTLALENILDGLVAKPGDEISGFVDSVIPPLVRTCFDFEIGDIIAYKSPHGATWHDRAADIGMIKAIDAYPEGAAAEGDEMDIRSAGLVIIYENGTNGVFLEPHWPALLPSDFLAAVRDRRRGRTHPSELRAFARTVVGFSNFDERAQDPQFKSAITSALRHIDTVRSPRV